MTTQLEQPVAHPPSRWYRNRWVKRGLAAGAGLAVIVGTFAFVLPQFANYGDVWARVENLSWEWIAVLLATVALNVVTFTPPWMAALPGLGFVQALTVTQASTASTYVAPGGPAVGVGLSAAMARVTDPARSVDDELVTVAAGERSGELEPPETVRTANEGTGEKLPAVQLRSEVDAARSVVVVGEDV